MTALLAAGGVSWFMVRRVSRPVEELAQSAESVAAGRYDVSVPDASFSSELHQLSGSFTHMAHRLAETETTRTRLLADLAHELRTPLATLEAYIDGMEDDVLAHDAAAYETMRLQVDRLRRLATDLRESSAAEEHALGIVLEPIDSRDVARAAVAAAAPRFIAKGVTLDLADAPEPCWILGDSVRLQQVLANLLDNALRHTPPGGEVRVGVTRDRLHRPDPRVRHGRGHPAGPAQLGVRALPPRGRLARQQRRRWKRPRPDDRPSDRQRPRGHPRGHQRRVGHRYDDPAEPAHQGPR